MYKLIVNNAVVDVVNKLRYVKYVPELKRVVITSKASADGICGSNNKTFYALSDEASKHTSWKLVTYFKINEDEFQTLSRLLKLNPYVNIDSHILCVRESKIKDMSLKCNSEIVNGFYCTLTDGSVKHFKLTIEDQLNLIDVEREVNSGANSVLYHATNDICKSFSIEDIKIVIECAAKHKKYHTTYFNLLKYCINHIENEELIKGIQYGVDLTTLPVEIDLNIL